MIDEISKMIELQKYWDVVVRAEKEIESAEKEISNSKNDIKNINAKHSELKNRIKTLKAELNGKDIELGRLAEKENDLAAKRESAQNEKQLKAFNNEIDAIKESKNSIEEATFQQMNDLEIFTSDLEKMEKLLPEETANLKEKIQMMTERISRFLETKEKNNNLLNENSVQFSGPVKSKFMKLLNSANKKAIVAIEKNTCSGCRNVLPVNDINELGDNLKLVSCQNCGKFIYREK